MKRIFQPFRTASCNNTEIQILQRLAYGRAQYRQCCRTFKYPLAEMREAECGIEAAVVWFRNDLRLADNQPLCQACAGADYLMPMYLVNPDAFSPRSLPGEQRINVPRLGPFRLRFVAESLRSLDAALRERGSCCCVKVGRPQEALKQIFKGLPTECRRVTLYYHCEAGPDAVRVEAETTAAFQVATEDFGVEGRVRSFWGASLHHPDDVVPCDEQLTKEPNQDTDRFASLPGVMTDFRKKLQAACRVRDPLPVPEFIPPPWPTESHQLPEDPKELYTTLVPESLRQGLEELTGVAYSSGEEARTAFHFHGGEKEGLQRLGYFLGEGLDEGRNEAQADELTGPPPISRYKGSRMMAGGVNNSAKLSAYLACGCLSPRMIYKEALAADGAQGLEPGSGPGETLIMHLMIRDFFIYSALKRGGDDSWPPCTKPWTAPEGFAAQNPDTPHSQPSNGSPTAPPTTEEPIAASSAKNAAMGSYKDGGTAMCAASGRPGTPGAGAWLAPGSRGEAAAVTGDERQVLFRAWACGRTGFPFVDACMRELAHTGYMSNRGRQNVANFLAKGLGLDWRLGAALFESLLVDYDWAANWGNWAYNAGEGADPRNRIFKTVTQGMRYDPDAEHIKSWVQELGNLPVEYAHQPWLAPSSVGSSEHPGEAESINSYPVPIIEPSGQVGKPPVQRGGK